MVYEPVAQENIVRFCIFAQPLNQRVAFILQLDPVAIMNGNQIDGAGNHDRSQGNDPDRASEEREPGRSDKPKTPDGVSDKQVTENKPDVEILVVGQGLETHLEAEGHYVHGAK